MSATKMLPIAAVLGATALLAAACGSSGTGGGSGASATQSATASSKYSALASYISKLQQRPTSINITEPIGVAIPKGKTIAYIQCGSPACVANGDVLEQAVKTAGWNVSRIDAGLTAESIKSAWDQAVSQHPDAVITSGFSRALFNPELAQLAAKKIPVIDLTTADNPGNGLTAVYGYGPQWTTQGKIIADYMLVNSGTATVKALSVTVSAYQNLTMIADGLDSELKAQCAGCSSSVLAVPVSSIGSDLPTRITSYLSAHPDVNWVYVGFADMMAGLPAALQSAGLGNVKLVTIDDTPASETYMKNGQSLEMSAGFDVREMMWRSVDYLIRLWTGKSTTQNTDVNGLPLWVITKDNLPSTTSYFPYVADYPGQYKKLWGVG